MLDAVALVQRRSPYFLVSEPLPPPGWARRGALYLCRAVRAAEDLDRLSRRPGRPASGWAGVVCFQGTAGPRGSYIPRVSDGGEGCLHYGAFAVYGDPELLGEVRAALAADSIRPAPAAGESARSR